ncbi:Sulfatase [compost metagenome]
MTQMLSRLATPLLGILLALLLPLSLAQAADKPNIVVIWGDDIGLWNLSAYNRGAMGYRTPNIDRIAREGAIFSDHYGQPSCTAGRAAFITGQLPIRSGMTTVGLPGGPLGLKPQTVTRVARWASSRRP